MMPPTLTCNNCGADNQSQAAFCRSCGLSLQVVKPTIYHSATGRLLANILLKQRYRIIAPTGKGGMGAVYLAEDTQLGNRKIAVKEMSQSGLNPQELKEAADAFKQEAIMLAHLQHRNLPSIFDHFEENGRWYLVMSFIKGETLEDYFSHAPGGKLPLEEVLQIGAQLCTVLGYLHNQQPTIIFRDLKPANIMRTSDGHIYLIDFGIARHFKPGQAKDTAYYGSMGYAPPEQYGKAQTTPRSDIYSLGVVLYQMLSGHDPSTTPFRFPPLQSQVPTVPIELATLITHMLELDENKRPMSVLLVSQNLKSLAAPPSGTLLTPPTVLPATPLLLPTIAVGTPARFSPRGKGSFVIVAILMVVTVVVGYPILAGHANHSILPSTPNITNSSSSSIITPTVTSVLTPIKANTQTGVICKSDWTNDLNGWNGSQDWKILNGKLLNDGTAKATSIISAPCDLAKIQNYKMEVKATIISQGFDPGFDFFVRYTPSNTQAYVIALNDNCQAGNPLIKLSIWPWSDWCNNVIGSASFQPSNDTEYTYDIVVKDNDIKAYVNGGLVIEAMDNRYLSGESVGLGDYEAQVSISSFKITIDNL